MNSENSASLSLKNEREERVSLCSWSDAAFISLGWLCPWFTTL